MFYSKIYDTIWVDTEREEVSDGGKLLLFYLMTCKHRNIIGLYRLPFAYVGADLGWELETVSKRFAELSEKGYIGYDEREKIVFVRNFLKHNPLDNANVEKSAVKAVLELPKTPLLSDFETVLEGLENRYERVLETVSNSVTITKTITKAEVLPGAETSSAPAPRKEAMAQQVEDPAEEVVERLPLNSGEYEVTASQADEWSRLYPAVDVPAELRKMRGWLLANKTKRKTKAGIQRFVNSWIAREQDKGGTKKSSRREDSFDLGAYEKKAFERLNGMEADR